MANPIYPQADHRHTCPSCGKAILCCCSEPGLEEDRLLCNECYSKTYEELLPMIHAHYCKSCKKAWVCECVGTVEHGSELQCLECDEKAE
jgi:hypothetical protein